MANQNKEPGMLEGGIFTDARGRLIFANDFTFDKIKRFYMVENADDAPVRAWHGHMKEAKYMFPVAGSVMVGAVFLDDPKAPSKNAKVYAFKMKAGDPGIFYVPEGYANGWKALEKGSRIMYFSTSSLEESQNDDYRFPWNYWGEKPWNN